MPLKSAFSALIVIPLLLAATLPPRDAHASIGPSLAIGLPHALNLAIDSKSSPTMSWGIAFGGISLPLQNSITLGMGNFDARLRWHPFSGSFFLGAILGGQSVYGQSTRPINLEPGLSIPTTVDLTVRSSYFTPHLGWFWIFNSGFTFGFECGIQAPFGPRSTLSVDIADPTLNAYLSALKLTPQYQELENEVEDLADQIGRLVFPYSILRIGWMF